MPAKKRKINSAPDTNDAIDFFLRSITTDNLYCHDTPVTGIDYCPSLSHALEYTAVAPFESMPVVHSGMARQVEGYYSNDDVMILLDALLKRSGFVRIIQGTKQNIVKNKQTGVITRTMVLAPVSENSEGPMAWLIEEINKAYNNNVEQVLVPVNIPDLHWYTLQLLLVPTHDSYKINAIIHDSLGIRKTSIVVEKLIVHGVAIASHIEGNLPKVQAGEFGARNVYCGGYTARLIADLALNNGIIYEKAWCHPDLEDSILRREDVDIVNEYNSVRAKNFGKESIAREVIMQAAENMSLLRNIIAEEKELKLLQEFKKIYGDLTPNTKELIKSMNIPIDPTGISAFVRSLYPMIPSVLKVLFQTNALGGIEKDENGLLKLDTNLEVEQILKLVIKLQRTCFKLEGCEAPHSDNRAVQGKEDIVHEVASLNAMGVAYCNSEDSRRALEYLESVLAMNQALYPGNHPETATSLDYICAAYGNLGDFNKALTYGQQSLAMNRALYPSNHPAIVTSLNKVGLVYQNLGSFNNALECYERGIVMNQALYPGNHPAIVTSLNNVGLAYQNLGNFKNALECYESGLVMNQALYRGNHHEVASSLHYVGVAYQKLGNAVKANDYFKREGVMKLALCNAAGQDEFKVAPSSRPTAVPTQAPTSSMSPITYPTPIGNPALVWNNERKEVLPNMKLVAIRHCEKPLGSVAPLRSKSFGGQAIHLRNDEVALNLLSAVEQFNKLWIKWVNDKLSQVNSVVYKTTLGFKGLDLAVDSARLVQQPGIDNAKKVTLDASYLYGMIEGVNGYSALVSGADVAYQLHIGECQKACEVAAGAVSAMAMPAILAMVNRPYLGFVYGLLVAANTAYSALENAHSFVLELVEETQNQSEEFLVGRVLELYNH